MMSQIKISVEVKVAMLLFFIAIFSASFIPDRYLGNCIIPLRNTWFVLATSLLGLFLVSIAILKGIKPALAFNAVDLIVFGYFLYVTINYFINDGQVNDLFISYIALAVFYSLVKTCFSLNGEIFKKAVILLFLFTGLFQGMLGFFQMTGITSSRNDLFSVTGTFFNPAPFAIQLALFLVFSVSIFSFNERRGMMDRILWYVSILNICFITVILPVTESRTAWIGGATGVLVVLFIKYGLHYKITGWIKLARNRAIIGLCLACVAISLLWMYKFKESSVHGRFFIWKVASQMVMTDPFFGNGFGGVRKDYNAWQAEYFESFPRNFSEIKTANQVNYVFNDYLQILIEQGIIGLIIFLLLLCFSFYAAVKLLRSAQLSLFNKALVAGSFAGLAAMVVMLFTAYAMESLPATVGFIFIIAIISSLSDSNATADEFILNNGVYYFLASCIAASFLWISVREFKSYRSYLQVTAYYSKVDRVTLFANNFRNLRNDPAYTLRYGKVLAEYGRHAESIKVLNHAARYLGDTSLYRSLGDSYTNLGNYDSAEYCYHREINIAPQRFMPRYNLVEFYLKKGDTLKALNMAQHIVDMPIKIESPKIKEIKKDMIKLLSLSDKELN